MGERQTAFLDYAHVCTNVFVVLFIYLFILQPLLQLICSYYDIHLLGDTLCKTCNYCKIHYNAQCNPCLTL